MANLELTTQIVALINLQRSRFGLLPLAIDTQLGNAAQLQSTDMALNDFFAQNGSNGSSPASRIENAGYDFTTYAQNIAAGQTTPEEVVN